MSSLLRHFQGCHLQPAALTGMSSSCQSYPTFIGYINKRHLPGTSQIALAELKAGQEPILLPPQGCTKVSTPLQRGVGPAPRQTELRHKATESYSKVQESCFCVTNPPFPQGTVFHMLPKSDSLRRLPWAFPPPPSPNPRPSPGFFSPWIVFSCVLTGPCTPKAAEERDGGEQGVATAPSVPQPWAGM